MRPQEYDQCEEVLAFAAKMIEQVRIAFSLLTEEQRQAQAAKFTEVAELIFPEWTR